MKARAIQRYARITPRKCNQVLSLIRGQSVEQAQVTLQFTPKYGARVIQKVLKSAVANALHEGKVRLEDLFVQEAVVGAGPTLKRWLPRIAVPTLMLWGASDGIVKPAYGRAYSALIPGARFEVIEAAGHHPEIEQPAAFAARVVAFLEAR